MGKNNKAVQTNIIGHPTLSGAFSHKLIVPIIMKQAMNEIINDNIAIITPLILKVILVL